MNVLGQLYSKCYRSRLLCYVRANEGKVTTFTVFSCRLVSLQQSASQMSCHIVIHVSKNNKILMIMNMNLLWHESLVKCGK